MDAESCWFPARLEWINSIRPLRYFVVTYRKVRAHMAWEEGTLTYGFVLLVKVVHIAVQNLYKELNGGSGFHTGVSYTQSTL
jgi:hypothetical protein